MTNPPRLAMFLFDRLASGPEADAMIGDALEQYAESRNRATLWRQIASIVMAQTARGIRVHKAYTLLALITGWFAYWLSSVPASRAVRYARLSIGDWLVDTNRYTPAWFFWTNLAAQTLIAYAFCLAIGWVVARLSRGIGLTGVTVFALSLLVLEGGSVAYWLTAAIATGRTEISVDAFAPAMFFLGRVICVMIGGLLGSKTAEPSAIA